MEIKSINYPVPLSEVKDIFNDNIDVFVKLEDGISYSVVVTTPMNILEYMKINDLEYIPASHPKIIVKSLTEENIYEAIKSYSEENAFWLKLLYITGGGESSLDIEYINNVIAEIEKSNEEILQAFNEEE
ncbi:hypothetical protein [Paenibacillus alvei]|uniref:Uncharacterized protein n=1 Tax=Paenibacillus alvei TaxID=44250 RepID=A0AAP7DKS2_PAEAL|nr:hypothetical protein [Paenibacillus alvei]NOJ74198.1 hypothetical protein [Paenibacillus alvei]